MKIENIGNDVNGAQLKEGTKVEFVGKNKYLKGAIGHVILVHDWNPNGPQTCEFIDEDATVCVANCDQLRRIK